MGIARPAKVLKSTVLRLTPATCVCYVSWVLPLVPRQLLSLAVNSGDLNPHGCVAKIPWYYAYAHLARVSYWLVAKMLVIYMHVMYQSSATCTYVMIHDQSSE